MMMMVKGLIAFLHLPTLWFSKRWGVKEESEGGKGGLQALWKVMAYLIQYPYSLPLTIVFLFPASPIRSS